MPSRTRKHSRHLADQHTLQSSVSSQTGSVYSRGSFSSQQADALTGSGVPQGRPGDGLAGFQRPLTIPDASINLSSSFSSLPALQPDDAAFLARFPEDADIGSGQRPGLGGATVRLTLEKSHVSRSQPLLGRSSRTPTTAFTEARCTSSPKQAGHEAVMDGCAMPVAARASSSPSSNSSASTDSFAGSQHLRTTASARSLTAVEDPSPQVASLPRAVTDSRDGPHAPRADHHRHWHLHHDPTAALPEGPHCAAMAMVRPVPLDLCAASVNRTNPTSEGSPVPSGGRRPRWMQSGGSTGGTPFLYSLSDSAGWSAGGPGPGAAPALERPVDDSLADLTSFSPAFPGAASGCSLSSPGSPSGLPDSLSASDGCQGSPAWAPQYPLVGFARRSSQPTSPVSSFGDYGLPNQARPPGQPVAKPLHLRLAQERRGGLGVYGDPIPRQVKAGQAKGDRSAGGHCLGRVWGFFDHHAQKSGQGPHAGETQGADGGCGDDDVPDGGATAPAPVQARFWPQLLEGLKWLAPFGIAVPFLVVLAFTLLVHYAPLRLCGDKCYCNGVDSLVYVVTLGWFYYVPLVALSPAVFVVLLQVGRLHHGAVAGLLAAMEPPALPATDDDDGGSASAEMRSVATAESNARGSGSRWAMRRSHGGGGSGSTMSSGPAHSHRNSMGLRAASGAARRLGSTSCGGGDAAFKRSLGSEAEDSTVLLTPTAEQREGRRGRWAAGSGAAPVLDGRPCSNADSFKNMRSAAAGCAAAHKATPVVPEMAPVGSCDGTDPPAACAYADLDGSRGGEEGGGRNSGGFHDRYGLARRIASARDLRAATVTGPLSVLADFALAPPIVELLPLSAGRPKPGGAAAVSAAATPEAWALPSVAATMARSRTFWVLVALRYICIVFLDTQLPASLRVPFLLYGLLRAFTLNLPIFLHASWLLAPLASVPCFFLDFGCWLVLALFNTTASATARADYGVLAVWPILVLIVERIVSYAVFGALKRSSLDLFRHPASSLGLAVKRVLATCFAASHHATVLTGALFLKTEHGHGVRAILPFMCVQLLVEALARTVLLERGVAAAYNGFAALARRHRAVAGSSSSGDGGSDAPSSTSSVGAPSARRGHSATDSLASHGDAGGPGPFPRATITGTSYASVTTRVRGVTVAVAAAVAAPIFIFGQWPRDPTRPIVDNTIIYNTTVAPEGHGPELCRGYVGAASEADLRPRWVGFVAALVIALLTEVVFWVADACRDRRWRQRLAGHTVTLSDDQGVSDGDGDSDAPGEVLQLWTSIVFASSTPLVVLDVALLISIGWFTAAIGVSTALLSVPVSVE